MINLKDTIVGWLEVANSREAIADPDKIVKLILVFCRDALSSKFNPLAIILENVLSLVLHKLYKLLLQVVEVLKLLI